MCEGVPSDTITPGTLLLSVSVGIFAEYRPPASDWPEIPCVPAPFIPYVPTPYAIGLSEPDTMRLSASCAFNGQITKVNSIADETSTGRPPIMIAVSLLMRFKGKFSPSLLSGQPVQHIYELISEAFRAGRCQTRIAALLEGAVLSE